MSEVWEMHDASPCYTSWRYILPGGGTAVFVIHNSDTKFMEVAEWEYCIVGANMHETEAFPEECKTLEDKLAYAATVARMS